MRLKKNLKNLLTRYLNGCLYIDHLILQVLNIRLSDTALCLNIFCCIYRCLMRLVLTLLHRLASFLIICEFNPLLIVAAIRGTKNLIKDSKVSDFWPHSFLLILSKQLSSAPKGRIASKKVENVTPRYVSIKFYFPFPFMFLRLWNWKCASFRACLLLVID